MIDVISTPGFPPGIGPYSQGMKANGFLFLSGQTPVNPETGTLEGYSIESQTRQVMENLKVILNNQGLSFGDVIKTTCFLTDMENFSAFNKIYAEYFTGKPARSCFAVRELPRKSLCEVELIAVLK